MPTEPCEHVNTIQYTDESSRSIDVLVGGVREMAKRLNISERSAYNGVVRGQLPGIKVGSRWVVPLAAFNRFLAGDWQPMLEAEAKTD